MQDDSGSSLALLGSTPAPSSRSEDSSITPPEAWGGEKLSDKFAHLCQTQNLPSRFAMSTSSGLTSSSMYSGLQDPSSSISQMSMSQLTNSNLGHENLHTRDVSPYQETSSIGFPEHLSSSLTSLSLGTKGIVGSANLDSPRTLSSTLPRRFSTYAERISTTSAFSDATSLSVGSPKTKKTGSETREELLSSLLSKSDTLAAIEPGTLPAINVRGLICFSK